MLHDYRTGCRNVTVNTGGDPEQGIWCCFTDGLNPEVLSSVCDAGHTNHVDCIVVYMYQVQLLFLHKSSTLYDNIDYYDDYREAYFADDDFPKRTCFKNNLNGFFALSSRCLISVYVLCQIFRNCIILINKTNFGLLNCL